MIEDAVKMLQWTLIFLIFSILDICYCYRRIYITRINYDGEFPVGNILEIAPGTNLTLHCTVFSNQDISKPGLTWGRRTRDIRFNNEYDLSRLVANIDPHIWNLQNQSDGSGLKHFLPFRNADQGAYFCMSLKYKLFKIVHIKSKNYTLSCANDKFRCMSIASGFCISSHYQCDGIEDCPDGSDEFWELCNGDPCEGKYRCDDGRCIPKSWCCDRYTDLHCTISIRHHCCPALPNPYDPLNWYKYNNNSNNIQEIARGSPRYLFIAVCVVSAILSFVLFLFVISKLCGFDKKPQHVRNNTLNNVTHAPEINNCGHSECAIRRELTSNTTTWCLYRTEEVSDPLIRGRICINDDRPPSYAEVVNLPASLDKNTLEDLINAPPPPYSSTNNTASNQESLRCDTNL